MKASIDELEPNTSQANYSEGFWRTTSQTNTNIEVTEKENAIRRVSHGLVHILLKRSEIRPAELFAFKASLILMTSISEFMFACF